MNAFGEIICDVCHKKFMKKSNSNRHIKTTHEKIEDFTCMKYQKKFKQMHHVVEFRNLVGLLNYYAKCRPRALVF